MAMAAAAAWASSAALWDMAGNQAFKRYEVIYWYFRSSVLRATVGQGG